MTSSEDDISLADPLDFLESTIEEGGAPPDSSISVPKPSPAASTNHAFVVDNVRLFINNTTSDSHRIFLDCPCCQEKTVLQPYDLMGEHLKKTHQATHISCPGLRCGKQSKELDVNLFTSHLETYHMTIKCPYCAKPLSALKLSQHTQTVHPERLTSTTSSLLHIPKKSPPEVQERPKIVGTRRNVTYEVLQNGQLLIVDGIHFFVRHNVAFMDCPMCVSKSMAMALLPEHIREHHHLQYIECPAKSKLCGKVLPWHQLLRHIVANHGRLPCEFCGNVYRINEMHDHMTKSCGASYYQQSASSEATTIPRTMHTKEKPVVTSTYKTWTNQSLDKIHEMVVKSREKTRQKCRHCGKMVNFVCKHIRNFHLTTVECSICQEKVSKGRLKAHMRTHAKKDDSLFETAEIQDTLTIDDDVLA